MRKGGRSQGRLHGGIAALRATYFMSGVGFDDGCRVASSYDAPAADEAALYHSIEEVEDWAENVESELFADATADMTSLNELFDTHGQTIEDHVRNFGLQREGVEPREVVEDLLGRVGVSGWDLATSFSNHHPFVVSREAAKAEAPVVYVRSLHLDQQRR